ESATQSLIDEEIPKQLGYALKQQLRLYLSR
ncbi:phage tail protein, partial [Salmonella enterica subsp. enterica serovar Virchow]|nr:phage tail protein [Salmonella enterica subsp. enterica serovar Virchow]